MTLLTKTDLSDREWALVHADIHRYRHSRLGAKIDAERYGSFTIEAIENLRYALSSGKYSEYARDWFERDAYDFARRACRGWRALRMMSEP